MAAAVSGGAVLAAAVSRGAVLAAAVSRGALWAATGTAGLMLGAPVAVAAVTLLVADAEVEGAAAVEVEGFGADAAVELARADAVGWYLLLWLRTELLDPNFLSQMSQEKSLIFKWTLFLWVWKSERLLKNKDQTSFGTFHRFK